MTLRWAHFAQEDHPAHITALHFAAAVEKRTDGLIKFNIFPNNQLGNPNEQIQQIKLGFIDMGLPTQGQLDKYDGAFAVVPMPFVFDGPEHVYRVLDGSAMEWMAPLAEKRGFILLHNWEYGFRNITNSVRPTDFPRHRPYGSTARDRVPVRRSTSPSRREPPSKPGSAVRAGTAASAPSHHRACGSLLK
jgi:TRAP-type C4-dicarboxylate transport system substrate-binding protein